MAIAIISGILLILILILFLSVRLELSYKEGKFRLDVFVCNIRAYSLKKKEKSVPESNEEKTAEFEKKTKKLSSKLKHFRDICSFAVKLLKKYVSITSLKMKVKIGTGDAAVTAISVGALWATIYSALGIVGQIMYIDKHNVEITPDYANTLFEYDGECIIKSRVVYIIIIAMLILFKIKTLKGKED